MKFVWLVFILSVFWLVDSGHFDPLLLSFGVFSVALVVWINHRMTRVTGEYQPPVIMSWRMPGYIMWLLKEIVKSNIEVVRCIYQRHPAIEPSVFKIRASQKSDIYKVLYANSITMTPGTITLEVEGDEFTIHALTRSSREGVESGDMDRRVRSVEN